MSEIKSDLLVAQEIATQLNQAVQNIEQSSQTDIKMSHYSNIDINQNVQQLTAQTQSQVTQWMVALQKDIAHIHEVAQEFEQLDEANSHKFDHLL